MKKSFHSLFLKFGRHKPKRVKKVIKAGNSIPRAQGIIVKRVDQVFGVFENGELIVLCGSEELAKGYIEDFVCGR